jgi:transglutaminase-like putative cysteine protease
VQDEVRYVSLSIGVGGLLARMPDEVTKTGYGDCKDKSLLLRTMLDKMGIEAYVALTDLDEGHGLAELKPAIWSFDHAIVKVVVDGATYWMDPTASHEAGDIYSSTVPDYGYALPLSGGDQQQLEPIEVPYNSIWTSNVDEVYEFGVLGAYFTVTTIWDGPAANSFRQRVGSAPLAQISEDYLDYYAHRYPGIRLLAPIAVEDDKSLNRMVVTERYLIPTTALYADGLREDFEFSADDFASMLPDPQVKPRVAPMDLGALSNAYHRVSVYGAPIDFTVPDAVSLYNDGFSYSFSGYAPAHGELVLEWSFNWNTRVVQPEAVAQILTDGDIVGENSWFTWDLRP